MKKILNIGFIILINLICIDFVGAETYNNYTSSLTSCGSGMLEKIPTMAPTVISILYTVIQIAVPVVLVIMGSIDLMKGITAGKEDEMKKGQQLFIKRLISGVLVFLVFIAVKLFISVVASDSESSNKATRIMDCADCFIRKNCDTKW